MKNNTKNLEIKVYQSDGELFMCFTSENLPYCIEFYKESKIKYIDLSFINGFDEHNLDCLLGLYVEGITIQTGYIDDFSSLLEHPELKFLNLSEMPINTFDFSRLENLEKFYGDWCSKYLNLGFLNKLKVLSIGQYKSATSDLSELAGLVKLEELHIIQSNIKSCNGLEGLKNLKKIGLAYNKKLETFTESKPMFQLEEFEVQVCKKLDLTTLKGASKLKTLKIINNGKITSLEPIIKELPLLEKLEFTEGELTDGNIIYFLRHPTLKEVLLSNKKHYLLKTNEINDALNNPDKKNAVLKQYR